MKPEQRASVRALRKSRRRVRPTQRRSGHGLQPVVRRIARQVDWCSGGVTVAADVEFLQEGEVGDIWRQATDLVIAQRQLAQLDQTKQALHHRRRDTHTHTHTHQRPPLAVVQLCCVKQVKAAHTRLPSVVFRS